MNQRKPFQITQSMNFSTISDNSLKKRIKEKQNEAKRKSNKIGHQYTNILTYLIANCCNVSVRKFFKRADIIPNFLGISKIEYNKDILYHYEPDKQKLTYKLPDDKEQIELTLVQNREYDINRRQTSFLIQLAKKFNITVEYTKSTLRKSKIENYRIQVISFFEPNNNQQIIQNNNLDEFYQIIKNDLVTQMNNLQDDENSFLLTNNLFQVKTQTINEEE